MSVLSSAAFGQLFIGHRGASYDAPENTLASYKLAVEQGADGFEGDYYLGADGHVLCLHDGDTKRVAGKKLSITKDSFEELRKLDIGSWKDPKWHGERIPTFEECLAVVPVGKKFFVELKSGPEVVEPIAKLIEKSSVSPDQIVIISFNADAIAAAKKRLPHIKALWLCGFKEGKDGKKPLTAEQVAATIKRIHADGLNAEGVTDYVNADFIKRLNELGVKEFSVWTIDDPKVAKFYADLGAWAITTNRPAWLREQLKAK
ncbi:MAG: glycerophosphodiester phosphodiesterase [Pirellulales bacterium]